MKTRVFQIRKVLLIVIWAVFFAALRARADFDNYNSILMGDQAAGMGGAATAMTEDSSSMAWYNPAGLAKLKGTSFSAAVGVYKKFDTRFNDDNDLTSASLRANQGFFQALPSSTGSVVRPRQLPWLQDWTLSLSILVPEYENFKGDLINPSQSTSTLNMTQQSLWVGGAMARRISADDSIGFTVYYTARSVSKSVYDRTYVDATHSNIFTEERNITQNAIVPLIGWHRDLTENWKLGLSYRFHGLAVSGQGELSQTTISNGSIAAPVQENDDGTRAHLPWKATVGAAYVHPGVDAYAFDVSMYEQQTYQDLENSADPELLEDRQIMNFSFGYEKTWVPWFKTRFGIFSNFSAHPNPDPSKVQGQGDHVDQGGFSANMAFKSENIEYTFGGYYTGGRGRSVQRIQQQYQVVTKIENVFTMLVGTSYSF